MPKKIALMTVGTRGDVQPVAVLANALAKTGYDVLLGVPENFLPGQTDAQVIEPYVQNLELVRLGPSFRDLLNAPEVREILSRSFFTRIRKAKAVSNKWIEETIQDMVSVSKTADAILFHPKLVFAVDVAEAINATPFLFAFQPITPTRDFPFFIFPWKSLGGYLNNLSYKILFLSRLIMSGRYNKSWRQEYLGLPPISNFTAPYILHGEHIRVLYSISPSILTKPSDWPEKFHLTGYWFPEHKQTTELPDDLKSFLYGGTPPVYIGFGSMPIDNPEKKAQILFEAINRAEIRAVIAKGWGGLDLENYTNRSDRIHVIDSASHESLFPYVTAVVHHGGAGTTHTGLRAGKPTLICPFHVDQPFWARRIHDLGVGPPPLPPKKWTINALASSLKDLAHNESYKLKADEIGKNMQMEDGVGQTIEILKRTIGAP